MEGGWFAALLLGLLQGVAEWLPVSSEGMVAAVYSLVYGGSLAEGVEYALWLHAGTAPAVLVALRGEVAAVVRDIWVGPARWSPVTAFLVLATVVSGVIGLPLLLLISGQGDSIAGPWVMALIGAALLVIGAVHLLRPRGGERGMDSAGCVDALLSGFVQGLSVIPGFSRSGLTTAALLTRKLGGRDALMLSFLMSVPASLGAALYAGIGSSAAFTPEAMLAVGVAFGSGTLTIRMLLRLAARFDYGWFLLGVGGVMVSGMFW